MITGTGVSGTFSRLHPVATTLYYALMIGFTMFADSPFFMAVSLVTGFTYLIILKGKDAVISTIKLALCIVVFTTLINMIFTHNGETILFYLGPNRITLEAAIFGLSMSVMIVSVIIWFGSFNVIMTGDKLIYIFGKLAPVLALVVSMIFRFIPLLKERYREIQAGQQAMLRDREAKGIFNRFRQKGKEISILIAWSLESSIESADSMSARGYGLAGRTSYHLFKITGEDIKYMVLMAAEGVVILTGFIFGVGRAVFYPALNIPMPGTMDTIVLITFAMLGFLPSSMDIIGEIRWRKSE